MPLDLLEKVGLIAQRQRGRRATTTASATGSCSRSATSAARPVGFGGRILPARPSPTAAPKYYNSSDTPLFTKSEQLYGLDQARQPAEQGRLPRRRRRLHRRADGPPARRRPGGGHDGHGPERPARRSSCAASCRASCWSSTRTPAATTGVDRALELFVSQDMDLAHRHAAGGAGPVRPAGAAGAGAVPPGAGGGGRRAGVQADRRCWRRGRRDGVEGQRRAVDAVLGVIALAPDCPDRPARSRRS